jgi:hypothetical protein
MKQTIPCQYQIKRLAGELEPRESGKQSVVLVSDPETKIVSFLIVAGRGLVEYVVRFDAAIHIASGTSNRSQLLRDERPCGNVIFDRGEQWRCRFSIGLVLH